MPLLPLYRYVVLLFGRISALNLCRHHLIEGYPNLIRILVKDGTQEEFTESHNVYSGAAVALHADDNDPIHKATVISGFGWELYLTRDDNGNASISATVGIITDIYFTRTSTTPEQTYQG